LYVVSNGKPVSASQEGAAYLVEVQGVHDRLDCKRGEGTHLEMDKANDAKSDADLLNVLHELLHVMGSHS
jgi:hypothetical protein